MDPEETSTSLKTIPHIHVDDSSTEMLTRGEEAVMTYVVDTRDEAEKVTAAVSGQFPIERVSEWMPQAYDEVYEVLTEQHIAPTGPPFARYVMHDGEFEVEAGAPVASPISVSGRVAPGSLPAGPVAVTTHVGPYDGIASAVDALKNWMSGHGVEPAGPHWEVYLTDPMEEADPAKWRTEVVMPWRAKSPV
ncbi:unannotated protein [freshwater metagenome]|uniref:Unannotated protein n=1 Tax=freshwater metagenome TaxID=449393 RepID=A0A6J7S437_9ZZZZ|nr:AraC family transcriptional regulator [Actinomycetota bacterium]MSW37413.1 AraC family transcriptional regulator [Actinomycetota bacterium]MSX37826.1 AraC family transcriptional regulator [Actinomycetota bacterium]